MTAKIEIEYRAAVDGAVKDIAEVNKAIGGSTTASKSAGVDLVSLKAGLDLAAGAYRVVEGAVKSVIDPTVAYAKEVRDLGRSIGASAEESSKLIQAADDVGISAGTLQGALEVAIRKGVKPTVEGISALADEYNAIQDPIARTKFLMDNFGRSGAALGPLMETGAEGIKAAGDEAERLGLVMDQEGVDSARRYEIAMDNFGDSVMAVKLAIAEHLLPAVSSLANTGSEQIALWKNITTAVGEGELSLWGYLKASAEVVWTDKTLADVNAELTQGLVDEKAALDQLDPAVINARLAAEAAAEAANDHAASVDAQTARLQGLADMYETRTTPAAYGYLEASDLLSAGLNTLTERMIFNQAAAGLTAEAALQLGVNMGLVDTRVLALNELLPVLKDKFDVSRDGMIDGEESAAGYADAVQALTAALMAVPSNVTSTVTTNFVQNGDPTTYIPGGGNANARANGGPVSAGSAYVVGEQGPEPFFPATDGYVMNNGDMREMVTALKTIASNGGGQTVNQNYYGYSGDGVDAGTRRATAGALA